MVRFRHVLVLMLCLALAAFIAADSLRVSVVVPPARVASAGGVNTLAIAGYRPAPYPADPALPEAHYRVLLPPEADPATVSLVFTVAGFERCPGRFHFQPAPRLEETMNPDSSHRDDPARGEIESLAGPGVGESRERPDRPVVRLVELGQKRKFKFAEIAVSPVRFDPATGEVEIARGIEVQLNFKADADFDARILDDRLFEREAPERYLNWVQMKDSYTAKSAAGSNPGYIIITTRDIRNGSNQTIDPAGIGLDQFVAHKENMGFAVTVYTEEAWAGGALSCDTAADQLRASVQFIYLLGEWLGPSVKYVLLVGDPHPGEFALNAASGRIEEIPADPHFVAGRSVPMKMCWPYSNPVPAADGSLDNYPTDFYYADLTGNWDSDGDGYFGEWDDWQNGNGSGLDRSPEVIVGRIPAYGTNPADFTTLNRILKKTMDYETPTGNPAYRQKALIAAAIMAFREDNDCDGDTGDPGDCGSPTYCAEWGEAMKQLAAGFQFGQYTLYEKEGFDQNAVNPVSIPTQACNAPLTNANFVSTWANSHYGLVAWRAHGAPNRAARRVWHVDSNNDKICQRLCNNEADGIASFILSTDAATLSTAEPSMVVQVGCSTGRPEDGNNLAYSLLTGGAVATCGSARESKGGMSPPWTPDDISTGGSASYGYYMSLCLMANLSFGESNHWCREYFGLTRTASLANIFNFNVYGDPSVKLNTGVNVPPVPTALQAVFINKYVQLTWNHTGSMVTGFRVERKDGTAGSWRRVGEADGSARSWQDLSRFEECVEYSYRLRATNEYAESGFTAPVTVRPYFSIIPSPVFFAAVALSSAAVELDWEYFGDPIDGFVIERREFHGPYAEVARPGPNDRFVEIGGQQAVTDYDFRIWGIRRDCTSPKALVHILMPLPAAPSNLAGTAADSTTINLTWVDNSTEESGFQVRHRLGLDGAWGTIATTRFNVTTYRHRVNAGEAAHYYEVRAVRDNGAFSAASNQVLVINLNAPANLTATPFTEMLSRGIRLNWTDTSASEDEFVIERSVYQPIPRTWSNWTELNSHPAQNSVTFSDRGLARNTQYRYRMRAKNASALSSYSVIAQAVTNN